MAPGEDSRPSGSPKSASRGSYVLRKLVEDVRLSVDGEAKEAQITCVELCGQSLEPSDTSVDPYRWLIRNSLQRTIFM